MSAAFALASVTRGHWRLRVNPMSLLFTSVSRTDYLNALAALHMRWS